MRLWLSYVIENKIVCTTQRDHRILYIYINSTHLYLFQQLSHIQGVFRSAYALLSCELVLVTKSQLG